MFRDLSRVEGQIGQRFRSLEAKFQLLNKKKIKDLTLLVNGVSVDSTFYFSLWLSVSFTGDFLGLWF